MKNAGIFLEHRLSILLMLCISVFNICRSLQLSRIKCVQNILLFFIPLLIANHPHRPGLR